MRAGDERFVHLHGTAIETDRVVEPPGHGQHVADDGHGHVNVERLVLVSK